MSTPLWLPDYARRNLTTVHEAIEQAHGLAGAVACARTEREVLARVLDLQVVTAQLHGAATAAMAYLRDRDQARSAPPQRMDFGRRR